MVSKAYEAGYQTVFVQLYDAAGNGSLVLNNAHSYVGRVFTLGSPHYGSELAELAYIWWVG